eukprot:6256883-Pyramimonas_sp.AAC.1
MTSFYRSSCANNGKGALNTPDDQTTYITPYYVSYCNDSPDNLQLVVRMVPHTTQSAVDGIKPHIPLPSPNRIDNLGHWTDVSKAKKYGVA